MLDRYKLHAEGDTNSLKKFIGAFNARVTEGHKFKTQIEGGHFSEGRLTLWGNMSGSIEDSLLHADYPITKLADDYGIKVEIYGRTEEGVTSHVVVSKGGFTERPVMKWGKPTIYQNAR